MQIPLKPENETERMEILHKLNLLDTPNEERFDRIARIASKFFGTDISIVNLLDSERQWFKAIHGLEGIQETPRDISFCGHTILQKDILVVEDALEDPRFDENPLVTGPPYVRFYAGCQIVLGGEYNIGTLCLADSKPRKFSDEDRLSLADLTAIVEAEFLKNYVGNLEKEKENYIAQLTESEAQNYHMRSLLQKAFDIYPGEILIINSDNRVQFSNQASVRTHNFKEEIGANFIEACPILNDDQLKKYIENLEHIEKTTRLDNRYINITVYPGKNDDTFKAMIILKDVTDKIALEKGLVHAEKIASIGSMAAGISHEIKNPLAAIKLNAQLAHKKITQLPEVLDPSLEVLPKLLDLITTSTNRIEQIISSMLHHCLNTDASPKILIDYKEIINTVLEFIKLDKYFCRDFKVDEVEVIQNYQTEQQTECVTVEIEQVLFNLIKNAYQAFTDQKDKKIMISTYEKDGMIILSIKDNGPGIPTEAIDKVFESLYSTKGEKGNGLGLAICRIIIEGQGGTLKVNPNYTDGAEFIITFPTERS